MFTIALYDSKPYDLHHFHSHADFENLEWRHHDFRLNRTTASTAAGAKAVCVFVNDELDAPTLKHLRELGVELILLRCAGFNQVNLEVAKELGLRVTRVPAYSPHAVAEHTVALLLALNRKIHRAYNRVREMNFALDGLVGFDLRGKTIGVVGTGKIGKVVAKILRGFDCEVLAYDPFPDSDWAVAAGVTYTSLDHLLRSSDVVTLHTPLTPETQYMLNEQTLADMKPGSYVINTSRGKLVKSSALIAALKSGHIGGVALDVYEEEQGVFFSDHSGEVPQDEILTRLLSFPNVLITGHQAFLTHEALGEIARVTMTNAHRWTQSTPFLEGTEL